MTCLARRVWLAAVASWLLVLALGTPTSAQLSAPGKAVQPLQQQRPSPRVLQQTPPAGGSAPSATVITCPAEIPLKVLVSNSYNQDGWIGDQLGEPGTDRGKVYWIFTCEPPAACGVAAGAKAVICCYANAAGNARSCIRKMAPAGMTCTPTPNSFSFSCRPS